jgi:hypothetical protein
VPHIEGTPALVAGSTPPPPVEPTSQGVADVTPLEQHPSPLQGGGLLVLPSASCPHASTPPASPTAASALPTAAKRARGVQLHAAWGDEVPMADAVTPPAAFPPPGPLSADTLLASVAQLQRTVQGDPTFPASVRGPFEGVVAVLVSVLQAPGVAAALAAPSFHPPPPPLPPPLPPPPTLQCQHALAPPVATLAPHTSTLSSAPVPPAQQPPPAAGQPTYADQCRAGLPEEAEARRREAAARLLFPRRAAAPRLLPPTTQLHPGFAARVDDVTVVTLRAQRARYTEVRAALLVIAPSLSRTDLLGLSFWGPYLEVVLASPAAAAALSAAVPHQVVADADPRRPLTSSPSPATLEAADRAYFSRVVREIQRTASLTLATFHFRRYPELCDRLATALGRSFGSPSGQEGGER